MDDNGNAIIVWEEDDDSDTSQIFKSEFRNWAGSGWVGVIHLI